MAIKDKDLLVFEVDATKLTQLAVNQFIDQNLRLYSAHSNRRGIPFIGDGFKEAQRKAMWGMLKRGESAGLISVERGAAHCAAETDYHHGIGSMAGTLVGLAQDFAGSNNMNFLVPDGQFGSRRSHEPAAGRYINTRIHENFRKIFRKEDDVILEPQVIGDLKIEPKYFIPLLPVVLMNGAEGMGTGHSTHISNYAPEDLRDAITKILDGQTIPDFTLLPRWRDFTGTVSRELSGQIKVTGVFKVENSTTIRVTELPVGVQSDKYEEELFKLEDKGLIKSFKNASDDTGFDFIISAPRTTTFREKDELLKVLKLESRDTENLTVWGPDGKIKRYESVEKLLGDFVTWRLDRYEERRVKLIAITTEQIAWYENVIRFIEYYLAHAQEFRNVGKKDLVAKLTAENFAEPERLLAMSIWTLTKDHVDDLTKKLDGERKRLASLQNDTPKKMYRRELAELKL